MKAIRAKFALLASGPRRHTVREHVRMPSGQWERLRRAVLYEAGGLCECDECRALERVRPAHEVDHYVPLFEGGTDERANLRAINIECHRRKSAAEQARRGGKGFDTWGPKEA